VRDDLRPAFLILSLAFGSWLGAGSASAQPSDSPAADTDAEARNLFEAGAAAYDAARYRQAYRYFAEAHELSGRDALLYNMALAADRARMDAEALAAYRAFLRAEPTSDRAGQARRRIAEIERLQAPQPTNEPAGEDVSAGWIVFGAGLAVAVAGGVLVGVGVADRDSVEGAPRDTPWADVAEANDRAPILMNVGLVALVSGLAASALGVTLALIEDGDDDEAIEVSVGPGGVSLRGRFAGPR